MTRQQEPYVGEGDADIPSDDIEWVDADSWIWPVDEEEEIERREEG